MSTTTSTMKHAAIYSVAAMAGRLIGFIMLPFYTHILRGHGYAVIGMLDAGLAFLLALLAYGMQGSIIRLYHDEKDPARKPVVVSTGITLIAIWTAILALPLIIFSRPLAGVLIDDAGLFRFVIMALVSFTLDMIGQAAASWLLIKSRSTQMAGLSVARLFIGLSLNIYLIVIKGMGLDGYFISSLATNAFSAVIFLWIAYRNCGWEFDKVIARRIRKLLFPLVPGSLAGWVGGQIERVLVKVMISLETVGILEVGYKFPVLISIVIVRPFMNSWQTRRFEIADEPGAPATIARMFTYFTFLMVWAGLMMAVVIKPVLEILTPFEFHEAYRIAYLGILATILHGVQLQLMFGLAYAKDTATISKVRSWTAGLKVLLSWLFIYLWGFYGAAISSVIASFVSAAWIFHCSQKRYYLKLEWPMLSLVMASGLGLFAWLTTWDFSTTAAYRELADGFVPWLQGLAEATFLADWKDGKVPAALAENGPRIAQVILTGLISAAYIVVLPLIHPPTRNKVLGKIQARAS